MFGVWLENIRFGIEVQQVVTARLMRLGRADVAASFEASEMVSEKVAAYLEGQAAGAAALARGASITTAFAHAQKPYRRRVRRNHRRLCRRS